jgi:hypothetical protein
MYLIYPLFYIPTRCCYHDGKERQPVLFNPVVHPPLVMSNLIHQFIAFSL